MKGIGIIAGLTAMLAGAVLQGAPFFSDGFEADAPGQWEKLDGKFWQLSGVAATGSQAVQRVVYQGSKPADKPAELKHGKLIALPGGAFDLALSASGGTPTGVPIRQSAVLEFFGQNGKFIGEQEFNLDSAPNAYRRTVVTVNPPAGAVKARPKLRVYITAPVAKTSFIRFDDLALGSLAKPDAKATNPNTIDLEATALDTSFENKAEGWQPLDGKFWRLTENAQHGKFAVQHVGYAGADLPKAPAVLKSTVNLPVIGGEKYRLSAFIRTSDSARSARGVIALQCLDADGKLLTTLETAPETADTARFTELSAIFDLPAATASVRPELRILYQRIPDKTIYTVIDTLELQPYADAARNYRERIFKGTPPAPVKLESPDSGKETRGNLSIGKFYRVSRAPEFHMADENPGRWTSGSKLTDGIAQQGGEFKKELYLGWIGAEPVEVTIDLGRAQTMDKAVVSGAKEPEARFLPPEKITVFTRNSPEEEWTRWSDWSNPARGSQAVENFRIAIEGKPVKCRYVRLALTPDMSEKINLLLIDEIELSGTIKNSWKHVPANGSYHGAFPPSYGFQEPLRNKRKEPMALPIFEKLVGKPVSMVLWYQGMSPERKFAEVQTYRTHDLTENYYGQRFLSLGWLPAKGVRLDDLIDGRLDDYFYDYFRDSMDDAKTFGVNNPIWFRPMNEFNAGWVSWGLEPDKFRAAWRRMYNIAEQLGAADRHIFVWSPNHRSYPDLAWNKMERYYPGDQYVDWVGVSCYPPSLKYAKNENDRYTIGRCREVNDKYGDRKPMMIAEGGYSDTVDRAEFVRQWFDFQKAYPNFKAMIWENHLTRVIQDDAKALELYRKCVQNPYWISTTATE